MASSIDLKGLFEALQKQMIAQLSTNREFIDHPGSKGDSLELTWIEWLRKYLPSRYFVDKAIVIDHKGNLSDQLDLVIYDQQFTPFVFTQNGIHYIPAEGVYAVFEVKPDFQGNVDGSPYIEYTGAKIASVRKLTRTSTFIVDRGVSHQPRPLTKILGGLLTSVNSIKKEETWKQKLDKCKGLAGLDLCCAADWGSVIVDYVGDEDPSITDVNLRIQTYYENRSIKGFRTSNPDTSLITFFLQLTRYLQQSIGTVAAIDLNVYSKSIGFDLDTII